MNKESLVCEIAEESGLTKSSTRIFINSTIKAMSKIFEDGDKVVLQGFGTFRVVDREPRNVRNAYNGEMIHVDGYKTIKFDIGKDLKRQLNNKKDKNE